MNLKSEFMKKPKMTPAIVYCIDENYALPVSVSLRSLLENRAKDKQIDIYLAHSKLSNVARNSIINSIVEFPNYTLHLIPINTDTFSQLTPGLPHLSMAAYFRILAPKFLPLELDHVLYLDGDTLILSDIHKIFDLYDPQWPLQACRDYIGWMKSPMAQMPHLSEIDPNSHYYNSGVLLINLTKWRLEKITEKITVFAQKNPEFLFLADQNLINAVLNENIGVLPPEWNVQSVYYKILDGTWNIPYVPQSIDDAKILHFTSEVKPWLPGVKHPQSEIFESYFRRTAWGERASVRGQHTSED